MENYNNGEFRKRSLIWKDSVQLIIHLTDVSFLDQITQICQTDKVQYVPENSYVILCPIDSIPSISAFHFVDYFDRFSPQYKVPVNVVKGEEREGKSIYTLTFAPGSGNTEEELNEIISILENDLSSLGLVVLEKSFDILVLGVDSKFSDRFLQTVSDYEFCHFIEANSAIKFNNKEARGITMTGEISNYYPETVMNITGKGVVVGVTDSGLDLKHCYFYDPSTTLQLCSPSDLTTPQCLNPSTHRKVAGYFAFTDGVDKSGHGTHVSGTVAGNPFTTTASVEATSNIGVAKDARLAFVDIEYATNSTLNIPSLLATVFPFQKQMGATISSNSFSASIDDGVYNTRTVEIDSFQFSNPDFLVIFAAGNAGQAYGSTSSYGNTKNGLSIGSVEKLPSVKVSVSSGAGLSPEQRIKPDVVAPGVSINSAKFSATTVTPSCTTTGQTAKRSGTSMAAPNVAGAAALVTQYYKDGYICNQEESCKVPNPSGALIKATLINSAQHFYETWYKGPGIEYTGFGRIDLSDVFDYVGDKLVFYDRVSITQGSDFTTSVSPSGKGALNIVLTWYEPAASAAASAVLINNLDLIVTSPSGKVYYGNEYLGIYSEQKDNTNTVERVLIPQIDIEEGDYTVVVNALAINHGSSQQFSLVINKESRSECQRCGKLRLSGGPSGKEGIVELFKGGQWWNVCGSTVNNNFAHSVCENLGFPKSGNHILFKNTKYGQGNLSIWDRNISCSETNFYDCSFGKQSIGVCSHLNDVSVSCDCPAPHIWDGSKCIISYCENGAKTFSSGPINITIPENFFPAVNYLTVSGLPTTNTNYTIVVKTWINHPRNSDLDVYLYSPKTGRYISAQKGLNFGYGFFGTTIRDDAPDRLKYYRYISDGPVSPIAPQDTFASLVAATPNLNGNWTLNVYDYSTNNGQTGFFEGWSISFLNECSCVRGKCDVLSCNSCDCSRTGYTGKSCEIDINECALGVCGENAECTNTEGSYLCGCLPGYQGDGFICSDIDECSTNNGDCDINAKCTNTAGSRTCSCNPGFVGDGLTCTDVDECLINNGGCSSNANCTNTAGSRTCSCNSGYSGDGFTCTDINECQINNGDCDTNAKCTNTIGSRTCSCNPGFVGDGVTCTDINECLTNNGGCSSNANCTNTAGSRTCSCLPGFLGNGFICIDINECLIFNGGCSSNAKCTNTAGSRTCSCNSGYSGDGITCTDVDECLTDNGGCSSNAKCTNTVGSRTCSCFPGFLGNGFVCIDINECLIFNGGCSSNAKCINTPGSRTCVCNQGFTGDGTTCTIAKTIALFEFTGNTDDSSSSEFSLSTTSQTFSSFYQRGNPLNQAISLDGNSPLTLSNVPLSAKFTIHLLFNIDSLSQLYDFITILPTETSPRSQAILIVSGDNSRRIKWTKTNNVALGQSQKVLKVGVTHSLVVSVRDGKVVTWLDDSQLGTYNLSFNGGNSFAISVGKNFNGFIDEFAVYSYPTYLSNTFNDETQCINNCPPGRVCVNLASGPSCA